MQLKALFPILLLVTSGCAGFTPTPQHPPQPQTKIFKDDSRDLSQYRVLYVHYQAMKEQDPLLTKELTKIVKDKLAAKGYTITENGQESQAWIMISYAVPAEETYTPPKEYYVPQTVYDTSRINVPVNNVGPYTVIGASQQITATTERTVFTRHELPGKYEKIYFPQIALFFQDSKETVKNILNNNKSSSDLFWSGYGKIQSHSDDIRYTAKQIINAILYNYPDCNVKEQ